jgi:hypothetical protein
MVATAPSAEEIPSVESEPKLSFAPSIVTVPGEVQETAESRDVVDTPSSGDITPSAARRDFMFSPPVVTLKKTKSNESKGSEKAPPVVTVKKTKSNESKGSEKAELEAADEKEEAVGEEPAADQPAAEEVVEETLPVDEKVEETAPVQKTTPVQEEPSIIMALLEKATAFCGSMESTIENKDEATVASSIAEEKTDVIAPIPEAEASDLVSPIAEAKASDLVSPIAKAKAAMSGCYNAGDASDNISTVLQSTGEKAAELIKSMKKDFHCQNDDLSKVKTEIEEVELKDTEMVSPEVEEVEQKPVEEEPKEGEPAPAVVEAPKMKKISIKKRISQRFKAVKKVIAFRTAKPSVVVNADE